MPDRRVLVTLTFATDSPPASVAMQVGNAIIANVADQLDSVQWQHFDLEVEAVDDDA